MRERKYIDENESSINISSRIYLVFERCSKSLKELMKALGPPGTALPLPALYTCLAQLVPALRFVHNMGVVHRDIKLENLLVSRVGGRLQVLILYLDMGELKNVMKLI